MVICLFRVIWIFFNQWMISNLFQNSLQTGISKNVLQILIVLFLPSSVILCSAAPFCFLRQHIPNFKARIISDRLGTADKSLHCFILSLVSAIPTNGENQVICWAVWKWEESKTLLPLKIAFTERRKYEKLSWTTATSRTACFQWN